MTALTEKSHAGEFILTEATGHRARDVVTLSASQTIEAGAVLGKITSTGRYKVLAPGASDGSEAAAAVAYANTTTAAGETPEITVIARDAEVIEGELVWPDGITTAQTTAALGELKALGIVAR